MRLLFVSAAARPHLYPLVPLAWACRAAGHEVRVASSPSLREAIVHTGLPAVVAGDDLRYHPADRDELVAAIYGQDGWPAGWAATPEVLSPARQAHLRRLARAMIDGAAAMVDDVVAHARSWRPQLIVHDAVSFAGPVAAAVLGVPAVRHLFGAAVVPRLELLAGGPQAWYASLFERFGVPATTTAALTVDPTPACLRTAEPARPCVEPRHVPYNGAGEVPRLPDGRRVCVTWGHTAGRALGGGAAEPYRAVLEALGERGLEAVVVTTPDQLVGLGPLPSGVIAAPSAPLHLVLPFCDLLVHQGGDGTTLTAAGLGVPQLAITRKPDAELAAGRIAAAGIGVHLRYQDLAADPAGVKVIGVAVAELLGDPAYRRAAERLRREIARRPPPAAFVPELEALAE